MLHIETVYATTPCAAARHSAIPHHAIVLRSCTCLNYRIFLTIFRMQYRNLSSHNHCIKPRILQHYQALPFVVEVKPQQWTGHNCGFRCKLPLVAPLKDTLLAASQSYKLSFFNRKHSNNF